MKRIIKLSSLVLSVLLMLTACSAVFDSAISGTIKDRSVKETSSTSTGGIADVMVYAYDNESTCDNKYSSWDGKSEFVDNTVPSAKTASDGSFSISNLRWITTNPAYGKDADSKTIYLLAFNKDYGLVKVPGRTIQSDKSNNFGIVYMDKATVTKTLVVKLKDIDDNSTSSVSGSDSTITNTNGFSFQYRYCDGYSEEDNVSGKVDSFTNGQATITVKYKEYEGNTTQKADVPSVTLYNIETGSDWTLMTVLTDNEYVINYDEDKKDFVNSDLSFSNAWKSGSVTVSLIDGSSSSLSSITDPIYFQWKYNNGEEEESGYGTTSTGSLTIPVKFRKDIDTPTLYLYDFDDNDNTNDDKWTWTESETNAKAKGEDDKITVALSTNKDNVTQKVYFRKNYIKLNASGISGYLVTYGDSDADGKKKASGYGYTSDYDDKLYLFSGDNLLSSNPVRTDKVVNNTSTSDPIVDYGYFTGLGNGVKLTLKYDDDTTNDTVSYIGTTDALTVKYVARGTTGNPKSATINGTTAATLSYNSMTTDFSVMLYK